MNYKLFIDDERYPVDNSRVISRSFDDSVWYITNYGLPSFISFDHDLGANRYTGMDIAKWIVNYCLDNDVPPSFDFYVHSQNPIGGRNVQELLDRFKKDY